MPIREATKNGTRFLMTIYASLEDRQLKGKEAGLCYLICRLHWSMLFVEAGKAPRGFESSFNRQPGGCLKLSWPGYRRTKAHKQRV
jgi:hypothetical protein